jgi:diadenosine tetraphosphate (Ap4A) HIT family hydrolase
MSSTRYRNVVWESPELVAYLHPRPWTPGSVILEQRATGSGEASIFQLGEPEYLSMLLGARAVGALHAL